MSVAATTTVALMVASVADPFGHTWWMCDENGRVIASCRINFVEGLMCVSHKDMRCACHGSRICPKPGPVICRAVRFAGFQFVYRDRSLNLNKGWPATVTRSVVIPLWAPLVVFAVWLSIALVRGPLRDRRRRRRGFCIDCGYNLRGLPENRCPECGKQFDLQRADEPARHSAYKCV